MVKRVLMIAYHFPPQRGSSGIQRTLKFSRYLPESGWEPIVLSAHPRAYSSTGDDQAHEAAQVAHVHRAFALDASRHLAIRGRYLRSMALPDRWSSWWLGAVPAGLSLIRKYKPDVIWSTYPIATAHMIGHSLHRMTGIPWVADFRDPMVDAEYPPEPAMRRAFQRVEKNTLAACARAVFTTPGALRNYADKFPDVPASRLCLIENGYDEENFHEADAIGSGTGRADPGQDVSGEPERKPFVLLHSGVIYPSERDPVPLFVALAALRAAGQLSAATFKLVLRAAAHEEYLQELINRHGIGDIVSLAPPIPYHAALSEMLTADGLLILQAANCNSQIPAKLYEYLRAQRPILALTDHLGDTAAALRKAGSDMIAPLDSSEAIMAVLPHFLRLAKNGTAPVACMENVLNCSRKARTRELADVLDQVRETKML